jgi:hypothetical protein
MHSSAILCRHIQYVASQNPVVWRQTGILLVLMCIMWDYGSVAVANFGMPDRA